MIIKTKFNGYAADGRRLYPKGTDGGAADAKAAEADRQSRIKSAVDRINAIFDSKSYSTGVGKVDQFDPSKTHYTADGEIYRPQTQLVMGNDFTNGMDNPTTTPYQITDQNDVNRALSNGLYTGFETVAAPAKTRQQLYDEQKTAVFDINKRDVDRQFKEAERATRFGLARNGLMGGSEDVDARAKLTEINNEGLIKAAGLGDQAGAELKVADERSRQGLISMAQSGVDTGTAQGMALRQLDATAQDASGTRSGATIGNLFADLGKAYVYNQQRTGAQAGAASSYDQRYPNLATSRGDSGSVYRG